MNSPFRALARRFAILPRPRGVLFLGQLAGQLAVHRAGDAHGYELARRDVARGGEVDAPVDVRRLGIAAADEEHGLPVEALAEDLHHVVLAFVVPRVDDLALDVHDPLGTAGRLVGVDALHLCRARPLLGGIRKHARAQQLLLAQEIAQLVELLLVEIGQMPGWCLAIVLLREFAVSGMRLVAVEQGRVIAAAWSGKVKTASTMVCLCAMLLNVFGAYAWFDPLCNAVIVLTTAYSGIEYFIKNADVFREPD